MSAYSKELCSILVQEIERNLEVIESSRNSVRRLQNALKVQRDAYRDEVLRPLVHNSQPDPDCTESELAAFTAELWQQFDEAMSYKEFLTELSTRPV